MAFKLKAEPTSAKLLPNMIQRSRAHISPTAIREARGGCGDALGSLLEFYRPYFLKIAEDTLASDLRPKLAPSDIVQGTFVLAAEKFQQFEGLTEDELRPWLLRIFRNHLIDGIRKFRYANKRNIEREEHGDAPALHDADIASPEEFAQAKEQIDRLLSGIERMPQQSRQIVRMRYLENLSYAEIGKKLDCTPDMARRVWLRAIDELGKELDG